MTIDRPWILALVAAASLTTGCARRKTPSATRAAKADAAAERAAKPLRRVPKTPRELPTTEEAIYLENLDGQIAELTRLVAAQPSLVANVQKLSAAHHVRGRFRGDLAEIQRGIDLATACIRADENAATCHLMRAEQEQSLHRFPAARADLARARALGADAVRIADLEADLDWNDGRYEEAIPAIRRARRERPSPATWLREAQLDHDLGDDDAADAGFEAAEDAIVDTAPLPVAHLDVQRGIQKVDRGKLEEACVFFRAAIERMPSYVAALEHLAETLHALGRDDEATALYEKVVKLSDDPEFAHALAELQASRGRAAEAKALEARALAGYDALLVTYPEAMYWHASELYLEIGKPAKALDLLRKNLALRPNSASHVALARAELANGHTAEAKAAIDRALAMPVRSAALFATAGAVYRRAGDAQRADAFREQARAIDPRAVEDEGDASAPAAKR